MLSSDMDTIQQSEGSKASNNHPGSTLPAKKSAIPVNASTTSPSTQTHEALCLRFIRLNDMPPPLVAVPTLSSEALRKLASLGHPTTIQSDGTRWIQVLRFRPRGNMPFYQYIRIPVDLSSYKSLELFLGVEMTSSRTVFQKFHDLRIDQWRALKKQNRNPVNGELICWYDYIRTVWLPLVLRRWTVLYGDMRADKPNMKDIWKRAMYEVTHRYTNSHHILVPEIFADMVEAKRSLLEVLQFTWLRKWERHSILDEQVRMGWMITDM